MVTVPQIILIINAELTLLFETVEIFKYNNQNPFQKFCQGSRYGEKFACQNLGQILLAIRAEVAKNSDSDFLVPAWNFVNNIAAIANYPNVIVFFFQLKCPPGMKKYGWRKL